MTTKRDCDAVYTLCRTIRGSGDMSCDARPHDGAGTSIALGTSHESRFLP